jgi:nitroreductase
MIMADSLKVMQTRRSCRAYKPQLIEDEKLEKIIKAGTFAATGRGKQSPIMIVVTNRELRDKLSKMNAHIMGRDDGFDPFYGAPELIVVLADRSMPTYIYDGSLVMGNLMNAAYSLGVDSCWIHRARETFQTEYGKELMKKWGLDEKYVGVGNCILGYAATVRSQPAARKENFVIYD